MRIRISLFSKDKIKENSTKYPDGNFPAPTTRNKILFPLTTKVNKIHVGTPREVTINQILGCRIYRKGMHNPNRSKQPPVDQLISDRDSKGTRRRRKKKQDSYRQFRTLNCFRSLANRFRKDPQLTCLMGLRYNFSATIIVFSRSLHCTYTVAITISNREYNDLLAHTIGLLIPSTRLGETVILALSTSTAELFATTLRSATPLLYKK